MDEGGQVLTFCRSRSSGSNAPFLRHDTQKWTWNKNIWTRHPQNQISQFNKSQIIIFHLYQRKHEKICFFFSHLPQHSRWPGKEYSMHDPTLNKTCKCEKFISKSQNKSNLKFLTFFLLQFFLFSMFVAQTDSAARTCCSTHDRVQATTIGRMTTTQFKHKLFPESKCLHKMLLGWKSPSDWMWSCFLRECCDAAGICIRMLSNNVKRHLNCWGACQALSSHGQDASRDQKSPLDDIQEG